MHNGMNGNTNTKAIMKEARTSLHKIEADFAILVECLQRKIEHLEHELKGMLTDIDEIAFKSKCLDDQLKALTELIGKEGASLTKEDIVLDQMWIQYQPLIKHLRSANSIFTLFANEISIAKARLEECEQTESL